MEIIVSDNASEPETRRVIDSFDDKRLRYIRPPSRLGMSEHWDFALGHASGNWVTIIGDDDGFLPGSVRRFFDLIAEKPFKAVSSSVCKFFWPDPVERTQGKLLIRLGSGSEVRESKFWMKKIVDAEADVSELPFIYTGGFLHIDIINRIKEQSSGVFFKSIIPDVYATLAACSVTDQFLYSRQPLAIAGISRHSNGRQSMQTSRENKQSVAFFRENKQVFHPSLGDGFVQSVPLIVYESFLQSSHLRSTDMGVKLQNQLALTIAHAEKKKKEDVLAYCLQVAKINKIDFDEIIQLVNGIRLKKRAKRLSHNIMRHFRRPVEIKKRVAYDDPMLRNIYDAAQEAGRGSK